MVGYRNILAPVRSWKKFGLDDQISLYKNHRPYSVTEYLLTTKNLICSFTVMSQRNRVRPKHRSGSLYSGSSQGIDWSVWLFRQWPVLRLRHRARGTSTWVALGDWTETNTVLQLFYYNTLPGDIPAPIVYETLLHTAWFVDVVIVDFRRDQCWMICCQKLWPFILNLKDPGPTQLMYFCTQISVWLVSMLIP